MMDELEFNIRTVIAQAARINWELDFQIALCSSQGSRGSTTMLVLFHFEVLCLLKLQTQVVNDIYVFSFRSLVYTTKNIVLFFDGVV